MNYSLLLSEGGEATLVYGSYVWTFFGIFVGLVAIGALAKNLGWLYVEKIEVKAKKAKNTH